MELLTMLLLNKLKNSGGGSTPSEDIKKDVNFYDYDGKLIKAYNKDEFLAIEQMPENPSHDGLIAEGWNWTLTDAKAYVEKYGKLIIGQNYDTESEMCEFDIALNSATGLTVNFNAVGTKDWGDGSTDDTSSHTYSSAGKYTIKCDCTSIPNYFLGQSSGESYILIEARITNANIKGASFRNCAGMERIVLSNTITFDSNGSANFYNCVSLKAIVIPSGITKIASTDFYSDPTLKTVCLPKSVTNITDNTFRGCYVLENITLPEGITSIGTDGFRACSSLPELIIPSTLTSIAGNGLNYCISLKVLDFRNALAVPTLANTTALGALSKQCKIIVPDSLYETWKTTQYWTTYANQIVKASEV